MEALPQNEVTAEPLIWTSKGNLPEASLQYEGRWEDSAEYVKFVQTYRLDGEVVKESCHVMMKRGLLFQSEQGGV